MRRFKSIDFIRGLSICWMIFGHLSEWWIRPEEIWYFDLVRSIGDFLGSGTFLFISGVSSVISYRRRLNKAEVSESYSIKMVKIEYLLRAFMILVIAIIWNLSTSFIYNDFSLIWNWFILQTISFSLFLGLPLLKLNKIARLFLGGLIWIFNQWLLITLTPYQGELNFGGIMFKIFYSNLELDPIFSFFSFFLIGTVIGDLIYDAYQKTDLNEIKITLLRNFFIPSILGGFILFFFGIFFQFPGFLQHRTFPWLIYSLGLDLIIFSSLFMVEEKSLKEKSKEFFFFYFSYYSFTIYLAHNVLYFLFLNQLNWYSIWILILITIFILGMILRKIYHTLGAKFSLKVLISKIVVTLTRRMIKSMS